MLVKEPKPKTGIEMSHFNYRIGTENEKISKVPRALSSAPATIAVYVPLYTRRTFSSDYIAPWQPRRETDARPAGRLTKIIPNPSNNNKNRYPAKALYYDPMRLRYTQQRFTIAATGPRL